MAAKIPVGLQDGDIIQLYCSSKMGYVYGEPGLNALTIDFHEPVSKPVGFLFNFSTFCVTLENVKSKSQERIAYGSAVYLQHQATHKFLAIEDTGSNLCLDDNKSLFKIISPNQLGRGKEVRNNDEIKLESMTHKGLMIGFSHESSNPFCPTLAADGAVFFVRVYCQNRSHETIKGSSVIFLGSCLKIEGFLCANGSFVNKTLEEFQTANNNSFNEICEQIGLLELRPGSFKRLPYYGDAFFQLEITDPKAVLLGDSFTYNKQCRIKHLFSLKYISVDESGKIILQDSANDSSKFKILPVHSALSQKEVFEADEILFKHVKTEKYLIVDVNPGSKFNREVINFNLDLSDDPSISKSQFKVSQVTNEALLDVYKAISSTLSLRNCLNKFLKKDTPKVILIQPENKKTVSSKVLRSLRQLQTCLKSPQSEKERLVKMLQFLKAFDIMIALLQILRQDLKNFRDCCVDIFSVLADCVNNGTLVSAFSIVKNELFHGTVLTMVREKIRVDEKIGVGAEKLVIALYAKNIDFTSTLNFDQVEAKDSKLLFTLALRRRINWHIQKKICDNELKGLSKEPQPPLPDDVRDILQIFVNAVDSLQAGIAFRSSRMFYPDQESAMKELHNSLSTYKDKGHIIKLLLNVLVFYVDKSTLDVDYKTYSEANELIKVLLKLLGEKFEPEIAPSIKILVLRCLRLLFKHHISESIRLSLDLIKDVSVGTWDAPEQTSYSLEGPHQPPLDDVALNMDDISVTTETSFTIYFEKVTEQLKKELNKLEIVSVESKHKEVCKKLLESIINEKDEDVCLMSIVLLSEILNAEKTLFSEAINSHFIDTKHTIYYEMRRLATMTDEKQLLSKLTRRDIDEELQKTLCEKFYELSNSCESDDEIKGVAYHCGLFDTVLEFVLESEDLQVHDSKSNELEILKSCFQLLSSITRQNKKAQSKLFIYWSGLLKMKPIKPIIHMINEIFYDNPDLCNKLTVLDIEKIFLTAIYSGTTEHYQLCLVLRTIIKNTNPSIVIKDLIAYLILEHSADSLKHNLLKGINKLEEGDKNDPNFCLLLHITELLVSCTADGECQYAKSVSCQIMEALDLYFTIVSKSEQKLLFYQLYKAVYHKEYLLDTNCLSETEMEEFKETLKELEDILQKQEEAEAEALQKQKHAKKMRNYITETTEKIEDAFAKKVNSDDFFTKIFEEKFSSCEVFELLSTLISIQKERSYYLRLFGKLKLEEMTLKILQFLTAGLNDGNLKGKYNYIEKLFQSDKDHPYTLFDLLNHEKFEIVYEVLVCLVFSFYFCNEKQDFQRKIIELVMNHDYSLIIRVHQLLRQVKFDFSKTKLNPTQNVFQHEREIKAALDVISLLCDRQQKEMQDAMRENKSFSGSGIVCQVVLLLSDTTNSMIEEQAQFTESKIAIAQKSAQALIEMCTGNYKNQEVAFRSQVIVSIDDILKNFNKDKRSEIISLISSCVELLQIMLEEIDENSPQLASWITNYLETKNLIEVMQQSFQRLTLVYMKTPDEENLKSHTLLFRAYHVLKRIIDYEIIKIADIRKEDDANESMWRYCEHRSRSIEIIYKPKEGKEILSRAYFPYHPDLHHIKDKKSVLLHIKRSTPQEKLLDLLKWAKAVDKTNKQENKNWCVHETFLRSAPARNCLLLLLTYILNLLIFTIKTPPDYNLRVNNNGFCTDTTGTHNETCNSTKNPMYFQPIWIPEIPLWSTITMTILGIIHAVLAILMVIDYFYRNWKPKCRTKYLCQNTWNKIVKWLLRKDCIYRCLSKCLRPKQEETQPKRYFQIFFESFQPIYRITFMVCSLLAWIPYPTSLRYLYCICMIYPFLRIDVMQYILRALKRSFIQLAVVFLLCFVLMYIYAVISFAFWNNYLSKEKDQFCGNILQCFFTVSRLGLLNTLGSEFDIRPSDEYEPSFILYAIRTVYDIIFFIVITTLALNIIIAILVDRFSEMRQTQDTVDKDDASKCFICGIEKSEFDKRNKDFKNHVQKEHNMWNYIRYIIYLKSFPKNDHNAVEKHISDKICDESDKPQPEGQRSIDFFPLFRAKALPDYKPSESVFEERLLQLITKTEQLEKALEQVKKKVE